MEVAGFLLCQIFGCNKVEIFINMEINTKTSVVVIVISSSNMGNKPNNVVALAQDAASWDQQTFRD